MEFSTEAKEGLTEASATPLDEYLALEEL